MKTDWRLVGAWGLSDFAGTAIAMNIFTTYFALWVIKDLGSNDLTYALVKAASMVLVIAVSPTYGALADNPRRRPALLWATLAVIIGCATSLALTQNLWVAFLLFALANVGYQLSTVAINALLPLLGPPEQLGRISGIGRTIGYLGSLSAVIIGMAFATGQVFGHTLPWSKGGAHAVFAPTAALALVMSLPLLLMLKRLPHHDEHAPVPLPSLKSTINDLWHDPQLKQAAVFMIGCLFFLDTVNTIRDFMGVYLVQVVGFSETDGSLQRFLLGVVLSSLAGAICWGTLTDRWSAHKTLVAVLVTLTVGFGALVVVTDKSIVTKVLSPLIGFAFGGIIVSARTLLVQLAPPQRVGELFGVFVVCNDVAAIGGPLLWGIVVNQFSHLGAIAYQLALASQLIFLVIGTAWVARVRPAQSLARPSQTIVQKP